MASMAAAGDMDGLMHAIDISQQESMNTIDQLRQRLHTNQVQQSVHESTTD